MSFEREYNLNGDFAIIHTHLVEQLRHEARWVKIYETYVYGINDALEKPCMSMRQ